MQFNLNEEVFLSVRPAHMALQDVLCLALLCFGRTTEACLGFQGHLKVLRLQVRQQVLVHSCILGLPAHARLRHRLTR